MKKCALCKEIKDFTEFHKRRASIDGYHARCKYCRHYSEKGYSANNIKKIRETKRAYERKKLLEDPLWRTRRNIARRIHHGLRKNGFVKKDTTSTIIGCTFEYLQSHLDDTFYKNYGRPITKDDKVHIDHIIPISSAKSEDDLLKLNHYSNLQYLLSRDNLKKSNKSNY